MGSFPTKIEAEAYSPAMAPEFLRIEGYYSAGDGGASLWRRVPTEPGHAGKLPITLADNITVVWYELAPTQPLTVQMFGAVPTASASVNKSAIEAAVYFASIYRVFAINVAQGILRVQGDNLLGNSINNPIGIKLLGPGQLIYDRTGAKFNNDTDQYRDIVGWEHGWHWDSSVAVSGFPKIIIAGNSIAHGDASWQDPSTYAHNIIKRQAHLAGFGACEIVNHAVSGTGISDFNPSSWTSGLLTDTSFSALVLFYGINEGGFLPKGDSVETYATLLRAAASEIRTARPLDLTVLLVCPTTATVTFDASGALDGRDEQWVEKVINVNRQVAREFGFVMIDPFAPYRDARNVDGGWFMDTPACYRLDAHIHPRSQMSSWLWVDSVVRVRRRPPCAG